MILGDVEVHGGSLLEGGGEALDASALAFGEAARAWEPSGTVTRPPADRLHFQKSRRLLRQAPSFGAIRRAISCTCNRLSSTVINGRRLTSTAVVACTRIRRWKWGRTEEKLEVDVTTVRHLSHVGRTYGELGGKFGQPRLSWNLFCLRLLSVGD